MQKRFLDGILGNKSALAILRVLARDRAEMTGRELARRAKVSPAAALAAAKKLSDIGLVNLKSVGSGTACSLNQDHYLMRSAGLGMLLSEEEDYPGTAAFELARSIKSGWIESIVLFGSSARKDQESYRDIDVLVLLKDSHRVKAVKKVLLENSPRVMQRFGVRVSPYVLGVGEFMDRFDAGDALMRNIVKDGEKIGGKSLSEVLVDERS